MPKKRTSKLIPYEVNYVCDSCGKGNMKVTGELYTLSEERFEHKCNNCGYTIGFPISYPYIEYDKEPIGMLQGCIEFKIESTTPKEPNIFMRMWKKATGRDD